MRNIIDRFVEEILDREEKADSLRNNFVSIYDKLLLETPETALFQMFLMSKYYLIPASYGQRLEGIIRKTFNLKKMRGLGWDARHETLGNIEIKLSIVPRAHKNFHLTSLREDADYFLVFLCSVKEKFFWHSLICSKDMKHFVDQYGTSSHGGKKKCIEHMLVFTGSSSSQMWKDFDRHRMTIEEIRNQLTE